MRIGQDIAPALTAALKRLGLDTIDGAFGFSGGEDLVKPGLGHRKRTRFTVTDESGQTHQLYIKRYQPEGLLARFKRWVTYGPAMSPAAIEFDNIQAARAAGVPTMQALVASEQWGAFGSAMSYIIVTEVPGEKLESIICGFLDDNTAAPQAVEAFTLSLADAVRKFHAAGYVHRDLYCCHLFADRHAGEFEFYLIDLARAFRPKWRRGRWLVKDLAQLKFSMPRARWSNQYWDQFMRRYLDSDDEQIIETWNRRIGRKVRWMQRRTRRKLNRNIESADV